MQENKNACKTAIITGGAKNIGRYISLACAENGMNVVVHYNKSKKDAEQLVKKLKQKNVNAWALKANLSNSLECINLIKKSKSLCNNTLYLLVNNASIFPKKNLDKITFRDIIDNVKINSFAPLILSRSFAKNVEDGHIVNILDARIAGIDKNHAAYILSKHLFCAITKICAMEYAPKIRVNAVSPGLIVDENIKKLNKYLNKLKENIPLKTHGTPQDIANCVIFLAKSSFITGQIIFTDGGRHLFAYNSLI
jgi:NAD(P)-dependent dehydrogenase (short-subunit alcohol dehydrogenase family)